MAVLDVVHYGDPILKKICKPITDFSNLDLMIDDMLDSMYEAEGIGLAANQVGIDMNLFIIDISISPKAIKSKCEQFILDEFCEKGLVSLNLKYFPVIKIFSITTYTFLAWCEDGCYFPRKNESIEEVSMEKVESSDTSKN